MKMYFENNVPIIKKHKQRSKAELRRLCGNGKRTPKRAWRAGGQHRVVMGKRGHET